MAEAGAPAVACELRGNHLYLEADAGAGRPLRFILETGAGMSCLDPSVARRLGLSTVSSEQAAGAGARQVEVRVAALPSLRLPGLAVDNLNVALMPFESLWRKLGDRFDGLLGYDVLSRAVVEIDYEKPAVRFHDPTVFRHDGRGELLPLTLDMNLIHVATTLVQDGRTIPARLVIDTGAGGACGLFLAAPFVREHRLPGRGRKTLTPEVAGEGIGGAATADVARIDELRLGGVALRDVIAFHSRDHGGVLARPGWAGVIGTEVLRRFRVTIDYARSILALEPTPGRNEAFHYDASGVSLEDDDGEGWRVTGVLADSPAARAAVRRDDRIVAVDGRTARSVGLASLRAALSRPGAEVHLTLGRGGTTVEAKIVTARLI